MNNCLRLCEKYDVTEDQFMNVDCEKLACYEECNKLYNEHPEKE